MNSIRSVIALTTLFAIASVSYAQTANKPTLKLDGAKRLIELASHKARELNSSGGTFAVVDEGGNLLALERMDGTFAASATVSIGKARTAALFKKPTKFFEELVNNGRTTMVALHDFTPLQGGMPIIIGDQIVGAIGVSGAANADQDHQLAEFAATSFVEMASEQTSQPTAMRQITDETSITFFGRDQVRAAFAKGRPLLELDRFKIHASRRVEPGMAEVHDDEIDIGYVVSGSATLGDRRSRAGAAQDGRR